MHTDRENALSRSDSIVVASGHTQQRGQWSPWQAGRLCELQTAEGFYKIWYSQCDKSVSLWIQQVVHSKSLLPHQMGPKWAKNRAQRVKLPVFD